MNQASWHLHTAQPGQKGFDCNQPVTPTQARVFRDAGYDFAIRYVARQTFHANDLTASETAMLLGAGLSIMVVQHVESESAWIPSAQKGSNYGATAAGLVKGCGLPTGVMVWLDLEGVDKDVPEAQAIEYAETWHSAVAAAGFLPGLYVGWHCGISAASLYRRLRFTHYWAAYNLNADEYPAVRGVQLRQHSAETITSLPHDDNVVQRDHLGGLPLIYGPTEPLA